MNSTPMYTGSHPYSTEHISLRVGLVKVRSPPPISGGAIVRITWARCIGLGFRSPQRQRRHQKDLEPRPKRVRWHSGAHHRSPSISRHAFQRLITYLHHATSCRPRHPVLRRGLDGQQGSSQGEHPTGGRAIHASLGSIENVWVACRREEGGETWGANDPH